MPKKIGNMIYIQSHIDGEDLVLETKGGKGGDRIPLTSIIHVLRFNTVGQRTFGNIFMDYKIQVIYGKGEEVILNFHTHDKERDSLFNSLKPYCSRDKDFIISSI